MSDFFFLNPDLHMHSVYSDGTDTPEALVAAVRDAGVDLFALTDHDSLAGCAAVRAGLCPGDPFFLTGVEFSCEDADGKCHMLGYCYDGTAPSICDAVRFTHDIRTEKAERRIRFLSEHFGFTFTDDEISGILSQPNPGKPHFVRLLLDKGYARDREEGFRMIGAYRGDEPKFTPEAAVEAILGAGGIPVLAHGILGDGGQSLTDAEIRARVQRLTDAGLMGLECCYSTYTAEQTRVMLALAERFDLCVTAGSDYHGRNKSVYPGQTRLDDPSRLRSFYRAVRERLS